MINCIEIICLFNALVFLRHTSDKIWTSIKWFLVLTVAVESSLMVIGKGFHLHNTWLVNVFTFINFSVLNWLLYRFSPKQKNNKLVFQVSNFLFMGCFLFEVIYKGIYDYTVASTLLSDALLFALCNRYFYLLLKEDAWIDIHRHAAFWFVTGIFLFNLCAIITDSFDDQLMSLYVFTHVPLYYLLYIIFDLILYGCWSFAFICKYQETI